MAGFCYQKNIKDLSTAKCGRKDFWREIRRSSTPWMINARRAIIKAVEESDRTEMDKWLQNEDFQKFVLRTLRKLKTQKGKENFKKKSDEKKLLAYADNLKSTLPVFIFSCYKFDNRRKLVGCHLNGLVMVDIDHVENPMEVWGQLQQNEELMARVVLVHLTSSGHGIRIIFVADITIGNLADNMIDFIAKLGGGYAADRSCIDSTRASYAPKEDEILLIDEERLFNYYDEEFDKKYTPMYRDKKTQPLYHQFPTDDADGDAVHTQAAAVAAKNAQQGIGEGRTVDAEQVENNDVKWRGYDIQGIIDARYGDKLPCKDDSNRHAESLKLATDLLLMLDGDKTAVQKIVEAQPWVQEIIDERNEDVGQTISSAADCVAQKEKKYAGSLPSKAMLEAVKNFCGKTYQEILKGDKETGNQGVQDITSNLEEWGKEIEALWDDFPLLRDVCTGLKRSQYPAAMFVAGGCLMTLMTRCWYRFYHRPQNERRLNCSLYIIGHPASNKSMADDITEVLMTPVVDADKAGKAALNRYKKDTKKKAANKEGKDKPQVIIREHPSRTSNGQMIEDMLNAKEIVDGKEMQLHMFTFDTELDNSITLQSGGSWINKQAMELKAFHNEKDGQMYQNSDSPVDEFRVTWNYIYTGTPIALKKKVNEKNFGSGLSTRLTVIPMPKTNFEMIAFEEKTTIDWQRLERMKEWAFKLDTRVGELPLWPLVKKLYDWTKNRMADCAEDNSEANELMLKRVPYHALNYSAPFIDMRHWEQIHQHGKYWEGTYEVDDTDWKLCELIARIQYATQQHFFGVMAEKYFDDMNSDVQVSGKRHRQKSVDGYNRLPEIFTREDVMRCFGYKNESGVNSKVKRLIDDKMIEVKESFMEEGRQHFKYKKIGRM